MSYTPGPWKIIGDEVGISGCLPTDESYDKFYSIAFVCEPHNIDLVAAAPELLEALKEMKFVWNCKSVQSAFISAAIHGLGETEETPRIIAAISKMNKAIDKAEGK